MIEVLDARLVGRGAPDGAGGTRPRFDVLVDAGRIARVRPVTHRGPGPAGDVLDAGGRLLLPGFVDAHSHAEAAVLDTSVQAALLRQGVTTVIVGQDGVSWAPSGRHDATHAWATHYFAAINGTHPTFAGGSVAELLATYDATVPVNVAYLAPYGTLRHGVAGAAERPLDDDELALVRERLERALDEGACGMSTGLEYAPARFADVDELAAVVAPLAARGLPHVTHMRGYQHRAVDALAEVLAVASPTGVATHVSHLHGPAGPLVRAIDDARGRGHDLTFDSYPYLRGSSILSMLALPAWVPVAEPERALRLLRTPSAELREHLDGLDHVWDRVVLSAVPGELSWAEGLPLREAAERLGSPPADAVVELLVASGLRAGCVFDQPPLHTAESVEELARHDAHMVGSDAIYAGSRPHPRGWGTFARHLAQVGTADGDRADAVERLSARAVRRFGLGARGTVAVGAVADLVLVDPERVRDRATYAEPRRFAVGVDDVLVAGVPVLHRGVLTGRLPGRAVRASAAVVA